ncbi:MAG TPA: serine/threonine protein kinase, partial [Chloroflexota bacterium]|nr:serine/threonine protein kinase [Chloroflexota bacterium]
MDLTGRHLGKYELLERLGQGGMAYVYKAHQPTIDRFVAVKVLHSHLADDAEFRERFKREA